MSKTYTSKEIELDVLAFEGAKINATDSGQMYLKLYSEMFESKIPEGNLDMLKKRVMRFLNSELIMVPANTEIDWDYAFNIYEMEKGDYITTSKLKKVGVCNTKDEAVVLLRSISTFSAVLSTKEKTMAYLKPRIH